MGNIQFSKVGSAILQNKQLAEYITHRLANITVEENKRGYLEVTLDNGVILTLRFAGLAAKTKKRPMAIAS